MLIDLSKKSDIIEILYTKRTVEKVTNKDLIQLVNDAIRESGYKKIWIAEKLGITRQALTKMFDKQNFSVDDANKILNVIGYETEVVIKKSSKKE